MCLYIANAYVHMWLLYSDFASADLNRVSLIAENRALDHQADIE